MRLILLNLPMRGETSCLKYDLGLYYIRQQSVQKVLIKFFNTSEGDAKNDNYWRTAFYSAHVHAE